MLTILLSILCSTLVFAAPSNTTVPWSTLKDDTSLTRFQSTLLNQTLIPFLNDCYPPQLVSAKVRIPCSRYFDAVLQLNSTDFIVQQPMVMKLLNEPNKDTNFCKQTHSFPAMKYYTTSASDFNNPAICGYMCIDEQDDTLVPIPICVFLAWMGEEIKNHSAPKPAEVPQLPENVPNSNDSVQPALTNAAANPDKPIPVNSTKAAQPIIPDTSVVKETQNISPSQASDKESQLINKKPESDVIPPKEKSIDHELNKVLAGQAAAEIIASIKKDKEPSTQQNPPPPPSGTEMTDEDALPKYPTNADKQDSFGIDPQMNEEQQNDNDSEFENNDDGNPEDGDEDDDHDVLLQNKLAKGIQTLAPAEPDQKSSLEIIDGNYLSKVNHVTDPFLEESGSNFFTYFLFGMFLCIVMYVVYHNKSKILALLLEGRRSDKGRGGRRKHTAAYRKLDSNLEEAITSSASGRITQIIY